MWSRRIPILFAILAVIAVSVAVPLPQVAADGGWYAEFFTNQVLAGSPAYTRVDPWIGADWGTGAPAPGISSEHFSVRWTRSLELADDGAYQFCAMADDGVRIWVDNVLVLDEWHGNNGVAHCGSQRVLFKGAHDVRVEYYDDGGNALIYVWWEEVEPLSPYIATVDPSTTPVTVASLSADAPAPFDGWYGEYFGNRSLAGKPDKVRLDPWIGFEWGTGSPFSSGASSEQFSIRWRRSARFEQGDHRFCAMADDGVRIWVDDALVVDEWHDNNGTFYCGTYRMTEGIHQVHVEYFENRGNALIYVWWSRDLPDRDVEPEPEPDPDP
jgi:hypothetical protein